MPDVDAYTHLDDDDDETGSEASTSLAQNGTEHSADAGFIILRPDASGASLRVAAASTTSFTAALGALRTPADADATGLSQRRCECCGACVCACVALMRVFCSQRSSARRRGAARRIRLARTCVGICASTTAREQR